MKILYVDDDRVNILLFQAACQGIAHLELRCEDDAALAIETAVAWQPDLFVLDHFLRGTTGLQLLDQLRAHQGLCDIPAVLCSADTDLALQQSARDAGFVACWAKPVLAAALKASLSALQNDDVVSS